MLYYWNVGSLPHWFVASSKLCECFVFSPDFTFGKANCVKLGLLGCHSALDKSTDNKDLLHHGKLLYRLSASMHSSAPLRIHLLMNILAPNVLKLDVGSVVTFCCMVLARGNHFSLLCMHMMHMAVKWLIGD